MALSVDAVFYAQLDVAQQIATSLIRASSELQDEKQGESGIKQQSVNRCWSSLQCDNIHTAECKPPLLKTSLSTKLRSKSTDVVSRAKLTITVNVRRLVELLVQVSISKALV